MGVRYAVQSASGHNLMLTVQQISNLGIVIPNKIRRYHWRPFLSILNANNAHTWKRRQFLLQQSTQILLMRADGINPNLFQISQGCMQSRNSRQIHGTRLKPVRQKSRNTFLIRDTAGTCADQRRNLCSQIVRQQKSADALQPQQRFMPGKSQGIQPKGFHVNRENACGLGRIQQKKQLVLSAKDTHHFQWH